MSKRSCRGLHAALYCLCSGWGSERHQKSNAERGGRAGYPDCSELLGLSALLETSNTRGFHRHIHILIYTHSWTHVCKTKTNMDTCIYVRKQACKHTHMHEDVSQEQKLMFVEEGKEEAQ